MTITERITPSVKRHAIELASATSILGAASVIVYYKMKYSGDVLFSVPAATMYELHHEGTAILQNLGHGKYTLTSMPKW